MIKTLTFIVGVCCLAMIIAADKGCAFWLRFIASFAVAVLSPFMLIFFVLPDKWVYSTH